MKKRLKGLAACWLAVILALHVMPATVIADASWQTASPSGAMRAVTAADENTAAENASGWVMVYSGDKQITSTDDLPIVRENTEGMDVAFDVPFNQQNDLTGVLAENQLLTGWKLWSADSGGAAVEMEEDLTPEGSLTSEKYSTYSKNSNNHVFIIPVWEIIEEPSTEESSSDTPSESIPSEGWVMIYNGGKEITSTADLPTVTESAAGVDVLFDVPFDRQENLTGVLEENQILTGWKLWSADSGGAAVEMEVELKPGDAISAEEYSTYSKDSNNHIFIIPVWKIKEEPSPPESSSEETSVNPSESDPPDNPSEEETSSSSPPEDPAQIIDGRVYTLKRGDPCELGEGSWTVDGDRTVYRGGRRFYAGSDGSYTFHQK